MLILLCLSSPPGFVVASAARFQEYSSLDPSISYPAVAPLSGSEMIETRLRPGSVGHLMGDGAVNSILGGSSGPEPFTRTTSPVLNSYISTGMEVPYISS